MTVTPGPTNTNITAATMANAQLVQQRHRHHRDRPRNADHRVRGVPRVSRPGSRSPRSWNKLYFSENGVNCTVTITPKFYARGQDLAAEMALQMNACTGRTAPVNVYTVTYTIASGRFTFGTTVANQAFTLQWTGTPNNIARRPVRLYGHLRQPGDLHGRRRGGG